MSLDVATQRPAAEECRSRRRCILATARVEAGRMARHPAFVVGLAASTILVVFRPGSEDWAGETHYRSTVAWTFAWIGALVAAALAAGRQRFASDPDLFPATPATPADRVMGTALGLVGPALAAGLAVVLGAVTTTRERGFVHGDEPYSRAVTPSVFEWAQPLLLVVLAGVVGIAVAQLGRGRLPALIVATMVLFFGGSAVWAFQAHPLRVLHPFMFPSYEERLPASFDPAEWGSADPPLNAPDQFNSSSKAIRFDTGALGWHLVYIAGLVLLGVWLAARMADRDGGGSRTRWLLLAGTPLVLIGGVAQVLAAGVAS